MIGTNRIGKTVLVDFFADREIEFLELLLHCILKQELEHDLTRRVLRVGDIESRFVPYVTVLIFKAKMESQRLPIVEKKRKSQAVLGIESPDEASVEPLLLRIEKYARRSSVRPAVYVLPEAYLQQTQDLFPVAAVL